MEMEMNLWFFYTLFIIFYKFINNGLVRVYDICGPTNWCCLCLSSGISERRIFSWLGSQWFKIIDHALWTYMGFLNVRICK